MSSENNNADEFPAGYHKSRSFMEASRHAVSGVKTAFASERNMKVQTVVFVVVIIVALLLQLSFLEIAIIVLTASMVVALEMVNTAAEHFADVVEPEYSMVVRRIKDFTAGAVLVISLAAVAVGLLLLVPPVILRLVG